MKPRFLGLAGIFVAAAVTLAACSGAPGRFGGSGLTPQTSFVRGVALGMHPDVGTAIKTIAWGPIPKASAGTPFPKAGKIVKVLAKNGQGKIIVGAYARPIKVADSDKTGATKFTINGKSAAGGLKKSSDVLKLLYNGLAIVPAKLSASSKGAKAKAASFAPKPSSIVYTGATVSSNPEIDLYSTTPNTDGYSGTFSATQVGWTAAPYRKAFTQTFAAIAGQANNCPGTSGASYAVSPASGGAGTSFTVSATSRATAGACAMTLAGGAGATLVVTLTYTSTGIGVSARHVR